MGKTLNLSAGPSVVTSGTLTTLTLTSAGAGGTTITVPSVAALTMARTDAAQTFAGVQSFSNIPEFTALTRTLVYRAGGITGKERPQVNVHDDGVVAGAHGYTVKGNGTDGSLEIFNCERVSLFKLVWRDGLITDSIVNHDDGAGDTVLRLRTCAEGLSSFSTLP